MNLQDFKCLLQSGYFDGEPLEENYIETHISWIAFSRSYAFKIKKPVKLSFLDFSTLTLRKLYCEREVKLNQRFSSIYLDVQPVRKINSQWGLGEGEGGIVDYAVRMKRMDSSRRMDIMLEKEEVGAEAIEALAKEVVSFHHQANKIFTPFNLSESQALFNDIQMVSGFIEELGKEFASIISQSIDWSDDFLRRHQAHIQRRIDRGFQRDVHGDLHGGNVFLYTQPILFDCIEFNDEFRQIDLLYEIAFLCMEFEVSGHDTLSSQFVATYNALLPNLNDKEDQSLYLYYKCLRANIRAKVRAIRAIETQDKLNKAVEQKAIVDYILLMERYRQASFE